MSDYFCRKCDVYRIRTDRDALVCPLCADMTYALHQSGGKNYTSGPRPQPRCGFSVFLDLFAGADSTHAPTDVILLVRSVIPEDFTESDVRDALTYRYRRFSTKIYEILLAVREAKLRDVSNVSQVRELLKDLDLKGYSKIAPKIMRLACPNKMRCLTRLQESRVMDTYSKVKYAFEEMGDEGYKTRFHYTMYKICQILGYKEFLQDIPLPGRRSVKSNDAKWFQVCLQAHLSYHPTH